MIATIPTFHFVNDLIVVVARQICFAYVLLIVFVNAHEFSSVVIAPSKMGAADPPHQLMTRYSALYQYADG